MPAAEDNPPALPSQISFEIIEPSGTRDTRLDRIREGLTSVDAELGSMCQQVGRLDMRIHDPTSHCDALLDYAVSVASRTIASR